VVDTQTADPSAAAAERLTVMEVNEAFGYLWPRLRDLMEMLPALTR
jgi:hypothetical protein